MAFRVSSGLTYVPGQGYVETSLLAAPTLQPQPTATPVAPSLTPEAESVTTGIEPQQLSAILYGKDIPVFVGGKMRIGGRIIEGPFFGGTSDAPTVSYIASHAVCANPSGTRTVTEFSLRGRVAWTSIDGALLDGLTVEFKTGSETQTPFSSSVTRYGDSAIAYRGHILSCVTDLPLSTFAGVVPFPSVLVEDSTFGDPDDGITREDALETILRYARLDDDEFEVDVTGSDIAWIIGQKVELTPFLQQLRKIFVNWNVTATDKLRIIEPGAFSVDVDVTRDNTIARSLKFNRIEPLTKPREKIYRFIDIDRDYEPNAATARQELWPFPTTASIESETIELPIVTDASQAVVDVNYALFQSEVSRKQLEYTGMVSLIGQEAGDGIQFDDHSHFRFRGRVSEIVRNAADWTVDVKAETWLNCGATAAADAGLGWDPDHKASGIALSDENRTATSSGNNQVVLSVAPLLEASYWEVNIDDIGTGNVILGVAFQTVHLTSASVSTEAGGTYNSNGVGSAPLNVSYTTGDRIGIAYRPTTGELWFRKNGTWLGSDPGGSAAITISDAAGMIYYPLAAFTHTDAVVSLVSPVEHFESPAPSGFAPLALGTKPSFDWNHADTHANLTLSENDTKATKSSTGGADTRLGIEAVSGKQVWAVRVTANGSGGSNMGVALKRAGGNTFSSTFGFVGGIFAPCYMSSGTVRENLSTLQTYDAWGTVGDVIMVATNTTDEKIWFGLNGVWNGDPGAGTDDVGGHVLDPSDYTFIAIGMTDAGDELHLIDFPYAVPSGFTAPAIA